MSTTMDKKTSSEEERKENASLSTDSESMDIDKLDPAAKFLHIHKDVDYSKIDISKVRHKVDRNVVSILCALYILAFLDKAIYNVSTLVIN
jgi:hypothetical protein